MTATVLDATSTIGLTKGRGRASSRARMMMIKPVNVNVGVDGTVSIIVGELDGCDLWSILVATSMQFFLLWH